MPVEQFKPATFSLFLAGLRPHSCVRVSAEKVLLKCDVRINQAKPDEAKFMIYPIHAVRMVFTAAESASPPGFHRYEKVVNPRLIQPSLFVDRLEQLGHKVSHSSAYTARAMELDMERDWTAKLVEKLETTNFDADYARMEQQ